MNVLKWELKGGVYILKSLGTAVFVDCLSLNCSSMQEGHVDNIYTNTHTPMHGTLLKSPDKWEQLNSLSSNFKWGICENRTLTFSQLKRVLFRSAWYTGKSDWSGIKAEIATPNIQPCGTVRRQRGTEKLEDKKGQADSSSRKKPNRLSKYALIRKHAKAFHKYFFIYRMYSKSTYVYRHCSPNPPPKDFKQAFYAAENNPVKKAKQLRFLQDQFPLNPILSTCY